VQSVNLFPIKFNNKKTKFWTRSPTQCHSHLQMKATENPWGSFVHPLMTNYLARKLFAIGSKLYVGGDGCGAQLPSNCYTYCFILLERSPDGTTIYTFRDTDNNGACSNLTSSSACCCCCWLFVIKFVSPSLLSEFSMVYKRLNIEKLVDRGESFYQEMMASAVQELEQKGLT